MVIELLDSEKLKIALSKADLTGLEATYDQLDYSNPRTKAILLKLLSLGKAQTGFSPKNSKLFIEIYPTGDEGCTVYFTVIGKAGSACGNETLCYSEPVIFEFDDFDTLVSACCKLYDRYCHRIFKSILCRMEDRYRLILYPLDRSDGAACAFLSEFGIRVGEGEVLAAFTKEHGKTVIPDNAVDKISAYLA